MDKQYPTIIFLSRIYITL